MSTKTAVPAVDGWFTMPAETHADTDTHAGDGAGTDDTGTEAADHGPALIGQRCTTCATYAFPPTATWCPNPACAGTEFDRVELARTGTVWSYTDARYEPPAPYIVPGGQFEPFALAAVELRAEGLVVLGQMVAGVGVDDLAIGTEVELTVEPLYSDDEHDHLIWKWRPVVAERAINAQGAV